MTPLRKRISRLFLNENPEVDLEEQQPGRRSLTDSGYGSLSIDGGASSSLRSNSTRNGLNTGIKEEPRTIPGILNTLSEGFRWSASLMHKAPFKNHTHQSEENGLHTPPQQKRKPGRWSATWSRSSGRSRSSDKRRRHAKSEQDVDSLQTPTRAVQTLHDASLVQDSPTLNVDIPDAKLEKDLLISGFEPLEEKPAAALKVEGRKLWPGPSRVTFDEFSIRGQSQRFEEREENPEDPFEVQEVSGMTDAQKQVAANVHDDRKSLPSFRCLAGLQQHTFSNTNSHRDGKDIPDRISPEEISCGDGSASTPSSSSHSKPTLGSRSSWESTRAEREKRFLALPQYDDDSPTPRESGLSTQSKSNIHGRRQGMSLDRDEPLSGLAPAQPADVDKSNAADPDLHPTRESHLYRGHPDRTLQSFANKGDLDLDSESATYVEDLQHSVAATSKAQSHASGTPLDHAQRVDRLEWTEQNSIGTKAISLLQLPSPAMDDPYEAALKASRLGRTGVESFSNLERRSFAGSESSLSSGDGASSSFARKSQDRSKGTTESSATSNSIVTDRSKPPAPFQTHSYDGDSETMVSQADSFDSHGNSGLHNKGAEEGSGPSVQTEEQAVSMLGSAENQTSPPALTTGDESKDSLCLDIIKSQTEQLIKDHGVARVGDHHRPSHLKTIIKPAKPYEVRHESSVLDSQGCIMTRRVRSPSFEPDRPLGVHTKKKPDCQGSPPACNVINDGGLKRPEDSPPVSCASKATSFPPGLKTTQTPSKPNPMDSAKLSPTKMDNEPSKLSLDKMEDAARMKQAHSCIQMVYRLEEEARKEDALVADDSSSLYSQGVD